MPPLTGARIPLLTIYPLVIGLIIPQTQARSRGSGNLVFFLTCKHFYTLPQIPKVTARGTAAFEAA